MVISLGLSNIGKTPGILTFNLLEGELQMAAELISVSMKTEVWGEKENGTAALYFLLIKWKSDLNAIKHRNLLGCRMEQSSSPFPPNILR